jgi:hypothetical protein
MDSLSEDVALMDELKSVEEVQEWLTRHEGLCWIAKSSLHL